MRLLQHFCKVNGTNCYVIGTDFPDHASPLSRKTIVIDESNDSAKTINSSYNKSTGREAIIIDLGATLDIEIIQFIEKNGYQLSGVFITHSHDNHSKGLYTLRKIYEEVKIYAMASTVQDFRTVLVRDNDTIPIGNFRIHVISVSGHSSDSAVFQIENLLFTGDTLEAGLVGKTNHSSSTRILLTALRSRVLSLPGEYIVLPGHGPPSTLEAERRFNVHLNAPTPPEKKLHYFSAFDEE